MSGGADDDTEKGHEPTQKKLDDARKRGEVPRSQDLNTAAAYFGLLIAIVGFGAYSVDRIGSASSLLLARAHEFAPLLIDGGSPALGELFKEVGAGALPLFLLPALAALVTVIAQRSFVVTGENLEPKASRISPIAQLKNKFGRKGLFEFAKSTVKLVVIATILAVYLVHEAESVIGLVLLSPGQSMLELGRLLSGFLSVVLVVAMVIGAIDYFWQYFEHIRSNRMSHKELTDEMKESEGDPYMKNERRRRGIDIALNRMIADVAKADVVVVNPTHYAVALKWSRDQGTAPICVAKGVDEIAARIRVAAAEAGVPVHRDPPTARALHATVELGAEIRPEHYRAVAAAIRFAERMRERARSRFSTGRAE